MQSNKIIELLNTNIKSIKKQIEDIEQGPEPERFTELLCFFDGKLSAYFGILRAIESENFVQSNS